MVKPAFTLMVQPTEAARRLMGAVVESYGGFLTGSYGAEGEKGEVYSDFSPFPGVTPF